jgi:hypothetical protein
MTEWIIVHGIAGDPIRLQVRNIVSYRKGQTEKTLIKVVGQGYDLLVGETPEEIDTLIGGDING